MRMVVVLPAPFGPRKPKHAVDRGQVLELLRQPLGDDHIFHLSDDIGASGN
jgi:hypothetical protein